jgi:hypothetical protein
MTDDTGSASRTSRSARSGRSRGPDPTIAVTSPFADEEGARTSPTWLERLRGLLGIGVLVVVSGVVLAVLIAVALLLLAVFVATTFN